MSKIMDKWSAIARLLLFGDERGTVSEKAEAASSIAREEATRLEATTENAQRDLQRGPDILRELLETFGRNHSHD